MAQQFAYGAPVLITGTFRDSDDVLTDPSTVTLRLEDPNGTEYTKTYPADIAKVSTGIYTYEEAATIQGDWSYRWESTGDVSADQGVFYVDPIITADETPPGTALTYVYTSRSEVERLFSFIGVDLRLDDLDRQTPWRDTYFTELVEDATDIINQYAEQYYAPEEMVNSRWVRVRATWIAAYLLSQRRGNPALFGDRYDEIIGELQQVMLGVLLIPRLPTRMDMTPAMSNLIVDERFYIRKLRVHSSISTGGSSGRQDTAYLYPFDWL